MIKRGFFSITLLFFLTGTHTAVAAEDTPMAGVRLGMTYEEADRALLADGYSYSSKGNGIYTDKMLDRIADVHTMRVSDAGTTLDVPVAVSFPYIKEDSKRVTITLLQGDASGSVIKVSLSQYFEEPYPSRRQIVDAFVQKYELKDKWTSCMYDDEAGFYFSKSTDEVVPATDKRGYACRNGLSFGSMYNFSELAESFENPLDLNYGLTIKVSDGYGTAPRGHVAQLTTTIGYSNSVNTGIAEIVDAARAANRSSPDPIEF